MNKVSASVMMCHFIHTQCRILKMGNMGQKAHQDHGFGCAMDIAIGLGPVGYLER